MLTEPLSGVPASLMKSFECECEGRQNKLTSGRDREASQNRNSTATHREQHFTWMQPKTVEISLKASGWMDVYVNFNC